tara:strand:+ start:16257 stop:17192 length:936 start_codon:yes stop_codon:yes gene_type:complete
MTKEIQSWRRLGVVIAPQKNGHWWHSHASYPTAFSRADGLVDIYFSVRDVRNSGSLAKLTMELVGNQFKIVNGPVGPLFSPGSRGAFDADGVSVTSLIEKDGAILAYYLGWSVGTSVPFTNFIGVAIREESREPDFDRIGLAPAIGRSAVDPYSMGYPWVIRQDDVYRMWYGSHLFWGKQGVEMEHVIKEAVSDDGLNWTATGKIAISLNRDDPDEFAVSRPCVIVEADGRLSMWFARRRAKYDLAFATSTDDGRSWIRHDGAISWANEAMAWDNDEQTYPCVFDHSGHRYMLYNGNGYGLSGFGLAILEK